MKFKNFNVAALMLLCAMLVVSVSSCHKDDGNTTPTIIDENAGSFTITNVTSGEVINENKANLFKNDTIKITFTPKEEYKSKTFKVECTLHNIDYLKKINDSIFVVDVQREALDNPSLELSASYNITENNIAYNLTAKYSISMGSIHPSSKTRQEYYGLTDFCYFLSSNLLQFVTPVVTYTTGQGENKTGEKDFGTEKDIVTIYKDENGKEHIFNNWSIEKPSGNWTKVEEFSYDCISYSFQEHYELGKEYNIITIKYEPNSEIAPSEDNYVFVRNLYVGMSYEKNDITIDRVSKEELPAYIQKLVSNPDAITLYFDKKGNAVER